MNAFEIKILDYIHDTFACAKLDVLMRYITVIGGDYGIYWIALAIILMCFKKTRKLGFSVALSLLLGVIICNLCLKNIVGRIRPYDFNTAAHLLAKKEIDYSFPSGHTVVCFEGATAIFIRYKKIGIFAFLVAAVVGFSRLYLYMHYPTDVLAGAILGIGIGLLASIIVDKLYCKYENKKPLL